MTIERKPRRAMPDKKRVKKAITAPPVLDDGGKKKPAKVGESGIKDLTVAKKIVTRQQDGKTVHCVVAETTGRSFGCYPTKEQAHARLAQIEGFKEKSVTKRYFVPITKVIAEEQTITGVVLQPEIVDAQGDIISAEVIRKAAHKFLSGYNAVTKLGLMHKDFKPQFELFESYIVPIDTVIGNEIVTAGSWVIVVHVLDGKIWEQVKTGKLSGFSIGGKAKVSKIKPQAAA